MRDSDRRKDKAESQLRKTACRGKNRDGSPCTRQVASGNKYCWQHAHGFKTKLQAFARNQPLTFSLSLIISLIGLSLSGMYFIAPLLPKPKGVGVTINGLRLKSGGAAGCSVYEVGIESAVDETLEKLNLTVQFPGNIASYKFGSTSAAELQGHRAGIGAFEIGKNATGECEVIQAALAANSDFTATLAGPGMVQVRGHEILAKTMAVGVFTLSMKTPSFSPAKMFKEGDYEYKRLGFSVSKPLDIVDGGIHDSK